MKIPLPDIDRLTSYRTAPLETVVFRLVAHLARWLNQPIVNPVLAAELWARLSLKEYPKQIPIDLLRRQMRKVAKSFRPRKEEFSDLSNI